MGFCGLSFVVWCLVIVVFFLVRIFWVYFLSFFEGDVGGVGYVDGR